MSSSSPTVQDRLLAQIDLAENRLDRFAAQLARGSERSQARFADRLERITARVHDLAGQIKDSSAFEVETETAVEDLGAAVDALEADLKASGEAEKDSYTDALDHQLRIWRSRTDRLRLQSSLGAMEIREDLEELGQRLDRARSGALVELKRAAGDTKEVVVDVRDDLENVLTDVRHALERVADSLTHESAR
ncbi:MAG: hypothetical protein ACR2QE_14920 [Acidimicrobiales bacterium]